MAGGAEWLVLLAAAGAAIRWVDPLTQGQLTQSFPAKPVAPAH